MNRQKNLENDSLHKLHLKEKYSELWETLESKISHVINQEMEIWGSENLCPNNAIISQKSGSKFQNSEKDKKKRVIPHREFVARPSLLTELLSVSHIQSVYHAFVAILLILLLNKTADDLVNHGRVNLGMSLSIWAFGDFDVVIKIWLLMKFSTTVLVYICFHHWAYNRHKAKGFYDVTGFLLLITYLILFLQLPLKTLLSYRLPPASSFAVLCEQVRFFMKTYAFVRSNVGRALSFKKDDSSKSKSPCPSFSHYLYFLFVPTLVYRDEYPRNKSCNWNRVILNFLQVVGCIVYAHFLFANFCIASLEKFGKDEFSKSQLVVVIFSSCFPGSILMLCGFFALLHCWMNAFAEMFRFADRMFYKDWWNSTSYARFYRTWNCVVHDWLYEYIFKEFSDLQLKYGGGIFASFKYLPMLLVFFISSLVHEYILSASFGFFYPVLLIMFGGFGVLFMFVNTKAKFFNIFMWMSLILGTGMLTCFYMIEWYARANCPPIRDDYLDFFIPRSWFCYNKLS